MKKKQKIQISIGVIILGIGYLAFRNIQRKKLFNQIAEKIGPGASAGIDAYDEWWNTNYWKNPPVEGKTYIKIGESKLNTWANSIYESAGTFQNDDEEGFYGILRQVPDGVALSQLADKFQKRHNEDLKEFIAYYYDDKDEQQIIGTILSQIPPFRITSN